MAVNDIKVLRGEGETRTYKTDDRATSLTTATIKAGEPVYETTNYVARMGTSEPAVGSDYPFVGIANSESTETSSANGTVEVITLTTQTVLRGKASTAANADTAAELLAYLNNNVYFDYDGTTYTIDENDTDDPNKAGLKIIAGSGDADALIDVIVNINATVNGTWFGQTID